MKKIFKLIPLSFVFLVFAPTLRSEDHFSQSSLMAKSYCNKIKYELMPYDDIIAELAMYLETEDTKEWGERTIEKMKAKNCFKGEVSFLKEQKLTQSEYWNNAWEKYDEGDIKGALKIHQTASRFYPEDYNIYREQGNINIELGNKTAACCNFLAAQFWGDKRVINYLSSKDGQWCKRGYEYGN